VCSALLLSTRVAAFAQTPAANPSRPTVTNPATLPPVGYLQFEQGYLGSLDSPETGWQYGVNQVTKIALAARLMVQVQTQPWARSRETGSPDAESGSGDVLLGAQGVLYLPAAAAEETTKSPKGQMPRERIAPPTVALGYLGRVHTGTTPDIDMGGYAHSVVLLVSGDIGKFHYDTNYLLNEQTAQENSGAATVRRAQLGQTLSVNHPLGRPELQLSAELYHFTQPMVHATAYGHEVSRANLVDLLIAPSFAVRPNLVLDGGFAYGFTSTSTRWQSFVGFTYLLPRRLWPGRN
jgi:hypothetical protein